MKHEENRHFQQLFSLVSAVLIALALLVVGLVVLINLARHGDRSSMIWFWPLAGATFLVLGMAFKRRLSNWVSPQVFLIASVPVLVLLLSAHVLLPYIGTAPWEASAEATMGATLDLDGDFLETLDGQKVSLKDYQDRLLFINFWATWCGPCRAEMPSMGELYTALKDEGLTMAAITDEDPETIRTYLEKNPYPFPVLLDREGRLFRRFRVFALPTTLVVSRNGQLVMQHQGGRLWNTPDSFERFRALLAE